MLMPRLSHCIRPEGGSCSLNPVKLQVSLISTVTHCSRPAKRPSLIRSSRWSHSCWATAGELVWPSRRRISIWCRWLCTPRPKIPLPPIRTKLKKGMVSPTQIPTIERLKTTALSAAAAMNSRSTLRRMRLGRSAITTPSRAMARVRSVRCHPCAVTSSGCSFCSRRCSASRRWACSSTPDTSKNWEPWVKRLWGISNRSRRDRAVDPMSTTRPRICSAATFPSSRSARERLG